jgi:hypothetical protein
MSFLPGFESDLFISYSSIDDQSLPGQNGWISGFRDALRIRLAQLLGVEPSIHTNHQPRDAATHGEGPHSVGILVSVVSPAYVGSASCLNEIKHFVQLARRNGGLAVEDKSRIFKVIKLPVRPESQPPEIISLLDYDFYQINPQSGHAHELNPEVNPAVRQNYWLKLDDLAYDIRDVLGKLSTESIETPAPEDGPEPPVSSPKSVFISYGSEDEAAAQKVCDLLEGQGISCWVAGRDAMPGLEYAPQLVEALDNASAVTLILSRHSNASIHVANEIEWATSHERPVYTVRIEDILPSRRVAIHVSTRQWVNAWVSPIDAKIIRLAAAIADEIGLRRSNESVYLAETTFDLKDERDGIRRELQQRGYNVLPDRSLPSDAETFRSVVRKYLDRSRLSIHLIGANYGDMPRGASQSLVYLQNELAKARRQNPQFSSLIWMPPGLEAHDERQRQFIDSLQLSPACGQQVELLQTSLEELKSFIEDTLTNRTPVPPAASPGGPLHIYLICDQQDRLSILPLRDYLLDEGYEAVLPAMTGDEAQIREDHKENLLMCDACLIYYGGVNDFWLRSKLRDLQKSAGYGRSKPMLAKAVYITSPETPDKINFRTLDAQVIKNMDHFRPEVLESFLAAFARTRTVGGAR